MDRPASVEYIVKVDGFPKYSGPSFLAAQAHGVRLFHEAHRSGAAEPSVEIIKRTVTYGGETKDAKTGEVTVTPDKVFEQKVGG